MTTVASLVPAAIDKLVTLATTALGSTARVVDGPGAFDVGEYPLVLHIGASDPEDDGYTTAADSDQEWAWLGHVARRAKFTIMCAVVAWNGNADQKAARDSATTALQALSDTITTDPTLGGTVIQVTGITGINYAQLQDEHGAATQITFGLPMQAWLE